MSIKSPVSQGGEPNFFVNEKGQIYFSWVEYLDDTTSSLRISTLENNQWSTPTEVARGTNWFVNWADFPSVVGYAGDEQSLAAHWLAKSAEGTYDYDIHIAQTNDGGNSWQDHFVPHRDSMLAEHGFVTMIPFDKNQIQAVWLDGRNTKKKNGAMTLRTALFDKTGQLSQAFELDNRVCDCCQTDMVMTQNGPLVAYRDRSENEIRDISIVRFVDTAWTKPQAISKDNWKTTSCPVNGPALAARANKVALAWFTGTGLNNQVFLKFSNDNGRNFGPSIPVDDGNPLGRIDLLFLDDYTALVSWIELEEEEALIKVRKIKIDGKSELPQTIARISASRRSGFPRMARHKNGVIVAWTEMKGAESLIKTVLWKS